jgi:CheY-like chemotaxis protein
MVLDTALSLILAACGVLLVKNNRLRLLPAIAVALLIIGLVNVAFEIPAISLHQLIFSFSGHLKMAKGSAVALLLLGVSLQRLESRDDLKDLHGLRILVIDDHPTNRLIFREMISSWGLISVEVANAGEGIDEIRRAERDLRPFAMVLLDREMPEIDGFAAIPLIRSIDPAVAIVMLASDTRPGDSEKRRSSGLAGYAVKPVTRGVLLRLIGDALRPACPPQPAMLATASSPAAVVPTIPINILVAEDSPDNHFLLESYLRNGPYIITVAEDGAQAVEKFATGVFDIVLMDMQMPVMDGLYATRAIRAFEQLHDLAPSPIVALTANAMSQHANESYSAGCNERNRDFFWISGTYPIRRTTAVLCDGRKFARSWPAAFTNA